VVVAGAVGQVSEERRATRQRRSGPAAAARELGAPRRLRGRLDCVMSLVQTVITGTALYAGWGFCVLEHACRRKHAPRKHRPVDNPVHTVHPGAEKTKRATDARNARFGSRQKNTLGCAGPPAGQSGQATCHGSWWWVLGVGWHQRYGDWRLQH
jgi:hypothetical protein